MLGLGAAEGAHCTLGNHWRDSVLSRGAPRWYDTNLGENAHKMVKASWRGSGKHLFRGQHDIASRYGRHNAITDEAAEHGALQQWKPRRNVASLRIKTSRKPVVPFTSSKLLVKELRRAASSMVGTRRGGKLAAALLAAVPELAHLPRALADKFGKRVPKVLKVVNFGQICAKLAFHPKGYNHRVYHKVWAAPLATKPRFGGVAVRAADGAGVWWARTLLLFSAANADGKEEPMAFMRYYDEFEVPTVLTHSFDNRGRATGFRTDAFGTRVGAIRLRWVAASQPLPNRFTVAPLSTLSRCEHIVPDLARTGGDRLPRNLFMVNPLKWSLEPAWGDDGHTANVASLNPFTGPGGAPFFFTDLLLRLLGHPAFGDDNSLAAITGEPGAATRAEIDELLEAACERYAMPMAPADVDRALVAWAGEEQSPVWYSPEEEHHGDPVLHLTLGSAGSQAPTQTS